MTTLQDLVAAAEDLWPGAEVNVVSGRAARESGLAVVPSASRPRVLAPIGVAGSFRSAVSGGSASDSVTTALMRSTAGLLLSSRAARHSAGTSVQVSGGADDSVERYLQDALGESVRFAIFVGSSRANRKPVLRLFRPDGSTLGFAKVGLTPLAARLVEHEASVLTELNHAAPRTFRVPRLLHFGRWRSSPVAVISEVATTRGRGKAAVPTGAMRELAGIAPSLAPDRAAHAWAGSLQARGARVSGQLGTALSAAQQGVVSSVISSPPPFGGSHGDWGPWNMGWDGAVPAVWDWERFDPVIPAGSDAVHFTSHQQLRRIGDFRAATRALQRRAAPAVQAVADCTRADADLIIDAYLIELATRYAEDSHLDPESSTARIAKWYLTILASRSGAAAAPGGVR